MQKRITRDLLTYLPAKALPALASFLTVPIYTHLFSPDAFGNYVLAVTVSEFLLLATVTGLGQGAVRFFSAYARQSRLGTYNLVIFGSAGLITVAAAAAGALSLVLLRPLIAAELYPLLWAALALFVASACYNTLADVLRGQEQGRWYSTLTVGQAYGGIVCGLVLVLAFGMGISGLIWGQTLGLLLSLPTLVRLTTRSVGIRDAHPHRSDIGQLWKFAWPVTVGNMAFWALNLSDRYIINAFHGSYEVGLYAVAGKLSSRTILLLASLFFLVPAPLISRLWEERGRGAAEEALTGFTRMFFLMVVPAVAGLTVVAAPLVRLLADEAYFRGYAAVGLVACAYMALGLSDLGSMGCLVANQTRLIARNQIAAAGVSLALNFLLVPVFGFMGAALSAAISFSLLAGLQAITAARFLTWRWPLRSLWRVLAASAIMAASVLLVRAGLPSNTTGWQAINLLLSIAAGALAYGSTLWVLGEISPRQLLGFFSASRSRAAASPVTGEMGGKR